MERKTGSREHGNTETAIMAAAEQLFLENGYRLTTTTMIAQKAGVTHAMLHYYFRTKEHIFIKVLDKYMDELLGSFKPVMSKDAPFWETLETGISTHFDFLQKHPSLPALLFDTARFNPELLESYRERMTSAVRLAMKFHFGMVEREIEAGRICKVDPVQLMLDIITLNMSSFMLVPVAVRLAGRDADEGRIQSLLSGRKAEIIALVKARLYCGIK